VGSLSLLIERPGRRADRPPNSGPRRRPGLTQIPALKSTKSPKNGFACIVNRDHPLSLKPTCFDAEGTATIVPKIVQVGAWFMAGKSMQEIDRLIQEGFASGRFVAPRRPGVAYMLSGDIRNVNPRTGQVSSFPPHVMFYAPNLTNADIGSTGDGSDDMPFIAYQGPHGFMIMVPSAHASSVQRNR
jgi:hypothetical protein